MAGILRPINIASKLIEVLWRFQALRYPPLGRYPNLILGRIAQQKALYF